MSVVFWMFNPLLPVISHFKMQFLSHRMNTCDVFVTVIDMLILSREVITMYSENYVKPINTQFRQDVEFV
jgi:hypothetical protein